MSEAEDTVATYSRAIEATDFATARKLLVSLVTRTPTEISRLGGRAEAHPLGFICYRFPINSSWLRIHLWSKRFGWQQSSGWQIHDHVFSFRSLVLSGSVLNKVFAADYSDQHRAWPIYEVNYGPGNSHLVQTGQRARLHVDHCELRRGGEAYSMEAGVLHRTKLLSDSAVTALLTAPSVLTTPRVVGATQVVHEPREVHFDRLAPDIDIPRVTQDFLEDEWTRF